jgi:replicative DNA helicase
LSNQSIQMAKKNQHSGPSGNGLPLGLETGKLPPQAVEVEEVVLGALMIDRDAYDIVAEILKESSFYVEAHQKVYAAIVELARMHSPIDILTVTDQLRKTNDLEVVGGAFFVAQLTSRVGTGAHIEFHARIVAQKYIQRELIRLSTQIQGRAFDESEDVLDLLEFSEKELFEIAEGNIKKKVQVIGPIITEAIRQMQLISGKKGQYSGIPSGFTQLDRLTSGWQKSDLVIIAARPSMGKTAFVLTMARNIAVEFNIPVAFFSLEMSAMQLVNRLIASETEIPAEKIKNGNLEPYEWQVLDEKIQRLMAAPIYIDDTPSIPVHELRAKCRRLKRGSNPIQLIVVDYLQLMNSGTDLRGGNREQEVSIISRSLKALAKDLDVPILALSQLNRQVEAGPGLKRPQLSHLRESGSIEQDADLVIFINRPERMGIDKDPETGNSLKGLAEIIIAKHRNGAVGDVWLRFKDSVAKFADLDSFDLAPVGEGTVSSGNIVYQSRLNQEDKKETDFIAPNMGFDPPDF